MNSNRLLPTLAVALSGCLWGSMGLFVRTLNQWGLASMQIVEIRSILTVVMLGLFLLLFGREQLRPRLRDLPIYAACGVFSVVFFNFCYFSTIQLLSLSAAAILLYTAPIFVMLLSALLFKERITRRKIAAILLAFVGCALVSGILGGIPMTTAGLLLGLGSGIGYALYSIFSRAALERGCNTLTITFWTFAFAALGGLLLTDFSQITTVLSDGGAKLFVFLLLYALVTTVAPYLLYTWGLGRMENSRAAVIASIEPVVATLLGILVFQESLTLSGGAGVLLVLAALLILR